MLSDEDVFTGLWEKYNQPLLKTWILTLDNLKAIIVLDVLTLLFTFSQSRAWVLLRYIVCQLRKPIRLHDDTSSEPLEHLSQGEAVADILPPIKYQLSKLQRLLQQGYFPNLLTQPDSSPDSSVMSPLFGIVAVLNIGVFLGLSAVVPYLISEGALGEATVKSKLTIMGKDCAPLGYGPLIPDPRDVRRTDAVLEPCEGRLNQGCERHIILKQPNIKKKRPKEFFFSTISYNETDPFEITHSNITAYEIGVNSKTKLTMSHRLTCCPIHLDPFLVPSTGRSKHVNISVSDIMAKDTPYHHLVGPKLHMELTTMNGPNSLSNEPSGGGSLGWSDVTILPDMPIAGFYGCNLTFNDIFTTAIPTECGTAFLIVYRGSKVLFSSPSDDPIFAAHTPDPFFAAHAPRGNGPYIYDHEATALGCLEQYQFCITQWNVCTPWGAEIEDLDTLSTYLKRTLDIATQADTWAFWLARKSSSVRSYIIKRKLPQTPVSVGKPGFLRHEKLDNAVKVPGFPKDHWVEEIEGLFMSGILQGIISTQVGAYRQHQVYPNMDKFISKHQNDFAKAMSEYNQKCYSVPKTSKKYSSCERILFRNSNYTNINWVGLWLVTTFLIIICGTSYVPKWLHKKGSKTLGHFIIFWGFAAMKSKMTLKIAIFYLLEQGWKRNPVLCFRLLDTRIWSFSSRIQRFNWRRAIEENNTEERADSIPL